MRNVQSKGENKRVRRRCAKPISVSSSRGGALQGCVVDLCGTRNNLQTIERSSDRNPNYFDNLDIESSTRTTGEHSMRLDSTTTAERPPTTTLRSLPVATFAVAHADED